MRPQLSEYAIEGYSPNTMQLKPCYTTNPTTGSITENRALLVNCVIGQEEVTFNGLANLTCNERVPKFNPSLRGVPVPIRTEEIYDMIEEHLKTKPGGAEAFRTSYRSFFEGNRPQLYINTEPDPEGDEDSILRITGCKYLRCLEPFLLDEDYGFKTDRSTGELSLIKTIATPERGELITMIELLCNYWGWSMQVNEPW